MTDQIEIQPVGSINATVRPPGSKSITNRALICAALADGNSILSGALDSEDTRVMINALRQLGISVAVNGETIVVDGCGGRIPESNADIHIANSGTTIRFLTAMLTLGHGMYRLDGIERMRQRPIGDLLTALKQLGANATSDADNDCPPVNIEASGLRGGRARIRGDISSQFLSGLLMSAPLAQRDVELIVDGTLVSRPYVRMTLEVMSAFGVELNANHLERFVIHAPQSYSSCEYAIEPDASAASYFWGAAAVTGGEVTVAGLNADAIQGDVTFCDCLEQMGCTIRRSENSLTVVGAPLRGVEVDMSNISDTAQTLGAVALFADGPTTMTGIGHIRHKETDRISDLARELRKLGAKVEELPDGMRITPGEIRGAEIDTYNDHRMAMSLALVGLRVPGVVIRNPVCTEKTYPNFFDDLKSLCN